MDNSEQSAMRSDAQGARTILALSSHLGDTVAITEAARRLEVPCVFVTEPAAALAACRVAPPALAVVDLTMAEAVPLAERLLGLSIPVLGFYPHVDRDLRERASRAGLARVVPRRAFFQRLPELLAEALERC